MTEGIEYDVALKDDMSAPAKHGTEAIDHLTAAIAKNDAALTHHGKSIEDAGHGAHEAEGFFKSFGGALIPQIAIGELAAESVKKVGEAAVELGEKLVEAGIELVHFSLESAEFKENMVSAFEVIEGSAAGGEEAFAQLQATAVAAHVSVEEAATLAKRLAIAGVEGGEQLSATVSAITALQRTGFDQGAAKLERVIEQSEALGHFELPKKLAGLGISVDALVGDLAKRLHKSTEEIRAELKAGKIATDVGISSITDAINHGNVGAIAAKKFDLTDVATDWHNVWVKLTEDVDASPLVASLRDFVSIFDDGTASGKTFKDTIVEGVNSVIRVLAAGVENATIFGLETEVAFLTVELAAKPMVDALKSLEERQHILRILGDMAQKFGSEMMTAADEVLRLADAWNSLLGRDTTSTVHRGHKEGEALADGLATGIQERKFVATQAAAQMGTEAAAALRKTLDVHSPSGVTEEIGAQTGEGFAQGVESSAPRARNAMVAAMGAPPSFERSPVAGGGSRSVTVDVGGIHVDVHGGGSESMADEIGQVVEEKLADVIERVNLELGG